MFGLYTLEFLEKAFGLLAHVRPGIWRFSASQGTAGITEFDQYEYISRIQRLMQVHPELKAALGGDYLITPDITVSRHPLDDSTINSEGTQPIVAADEPYAAHTPLRSANFADPKRTLHASISCKWTMRSDRSQNTRTEALNLIRNRKGRTPIIAVVTFEPLPARIASIAMGTGDVDCTYHGALPELVAAANEGPHEDAAETLRMLVDGRRLRDISDLPFDLAI